MNYIAEQNALVLYWDLPDDFTKGDKYTLTVDGKSYDTTACHLKVTGLQPDTEYKAELEYKGAVETLVAKTLAVAKRIDITKAPYNAIGDGKTLNTVAIQKALDDCGKGECVYIPEGDFLTGSLKLHSDMELYLDKGAILHGTTNVDDYKPKIKSRFEGYEMFCYSGLLNIGELSRDEYTCRNVRICGEGTICGGGLELANNVIAVETVLMKEELEALGDKIKEYEMPTTVPARARPRLINISSCENVVINGVTIANGPCWNVHMIYSNNIVTYGSTFRSSGVFNGDGWDPDSSTNCTIFGCEFFTGDDAVAIKSGKNPEGNVINRPCEHIKIFDCKSSQGHGVTIGSEMSGGVNDVRIWNCDMDDAVYGVEIKGTKKRGGYVKNVSVRSTKACRLLVHSVGYNDDGEGAPEAPVFENYLFEDICLTARMQDYEGNKIDCEAIEVSGFDNADHCARNIKFKNITIDSGSEDRKHTIIVSNCEGITFENIKCK